MAKKIWKYRLRNLPVEVLSVPVGAKIIHIEEQMKLITLWIEADSHEEAREEFVFYLVMTGGLVPEDAVHVKTMLMSYHDLEAHLYQKK